ncbi:hypothetical protein [Pseudalkalibacillus caeni]|uniref:Uncharacterized protein n=1 Tax=Exobacillus caeni TaxID=2574798 RepID=A0A5R9F3G8_9BACL|nr:hypothetical protein [Pseudalkalibacillus caeni]TLS37039.1 hypothetical protein FCL54_10935 [Pseudalkalibacillus caeni]
MFNYPNAKFVHYSLEDKSNNLLYTSTANINEKDVVYQKIPQDVSNSFQYLHYEILDSEGNVLVEK